jgi:hypothetical protein
MNAPITKEELGEKLRDHWFSSFKLRMFISGKSPEPKRSGPPQVESDAKDQ